MTAAPRPRPVLRQPDTTTALERELRATLDAEVRFDAGSRGLYSTDASNYRQVPIGVVVPRTIDAVVAGVAACHRHDAPLLPRGGGTSLAGQCCNTAVVIDFSKYLHHLVELDAANRRARVQPGLILDDLRDRAEAHGLTFAPDPATHSHNTLGGMLGNNSCGVHSVMGGMTDDNLIEMEVLTYDGLRLRVGPTAEDELEQLGRQGGRRGQIYAALRTLRDRYAGLIRTRFPQIPRRVSGYNLPQLLPEHGCNIARALVGSEGTCVTILEATVRLVPSPPARTLLVLGYADAYCAADHVMEVLAAGPIGLEGMEAKLVQDMQATGLHPRDASLLPQGGGWLLVEFGGSSRDEADAKARQLMQQLEGRADAPTMKLFDDPQQAGMIWAVRAAGLGATAHVPGKPLAWAGWEDAAVPPEKLGAYLREFRRLLERYHYSGDFYGHFGQGCIHTRIDFDLESQAGIEKFHAFLGDAADLVLHYGGSLSGEHGDGQARAEFLGRMYGPELLQAFGEFKRIWDPQCRMNPGKIVDPYGATDNLRLGRDRAPRALATHFKFPEDDHDFGRSVLRCVGVGNCRRTHHETMCPSFMATREERYSTRGRARLLFEMLEGEVVTGGWRNEQVHEALDYCLACKGCKGDCPVQVDMASYKAEFQSHYYEGRLRPRAAHSMGRIHDWARLAAHAPRLVNRLERSTLLSPWLKRLAGIAQQREMPAFAGETLRKWFARRPPRTDAGRRVLLWPDTFTNHFRPATGQAAVEVLEHAGCTVVMPQRDLCCGRPLYDWGMLERAARLWQTTLAALQTEIRAGTPVVGLEPACVAAFRDELGQLYPHDADARRLARQTYTLAEYLLEIGYVPHWLTGRAIVQTHCNHQAVMGNAADRAVLDQLGLDYRFLDAGCCGMAGSFGFEQRKYAMSQTIAERALLPAVRAAAPETLVLADGFSCREQIRQGCGRQTLHLAEVLQMAIHHGTPPPPRIQAPKPPRRKNIGETA